MAGGKGFIHVGALGKTLLNGDVIPRLLPSCPIQIHVAGLFVEYGLWHPVSVEWGLVSVVSRGGTKAQMGK